MRYFIFQKSISLIQNLLNAEIPHPKLLLLLFLTEESTGYMASNGVGCYYCIYNSSISVEFFLARAFKLASITL